MEISDLFTEEKSIQIGKGILEENLTVLKANSRLQKDLKKFKRRIIGICGIGALKYKEDILAQLMKINFSKEESKQFLSYVEGKIINIQSHYLFLRRIGIEISTDKPYYQVTYLKREFI